MQVSFFRSHLLAKGTFLLFISLSPAGVIAQNYIDASTPAGIARGTPAGTYQLSGFDNVNLFNGHLNFRLPLIQLKGRGEAGYTMTVPIEQVWTAQLADFNSLTYAPNYNWWEGIKPGYSPGVIQARHQSAGCNDSQTVSFVDGITRLTFTMPDGTEYELIDQVFGGQVASSICDLSNYNPQNGVSRGTTWVTRDGTAATFISDQVIRDVLVATSGPWITYPSGHLKTRDGTVYRVVSGRVQWIRDRNGNRMDFEYNSNLKVSAIIDSMNRRYTVEYDVQDPQHGTCDRISFKGHNGAPRTILVVHKDLEFALDAGQVRKTYGGANGLFPELAGSASTYHNPRVTSRVVLPNGRSFQFLYNSYGELTRVTLPTGGSFSYTWGAGLETGVPSGAVLPEIYRRVLEKRVYNETGSLAGLTTFGRYDTPFGTEGSVLVKQHSTDGSATVISQSKHYFHSGPLAHSNESWMWLPDQIDGREKKTEVFNQSGSAVLERTTQSWTYGGSVAGTSINPHVSETIKTIEPASANLVSKQSFLYDPYNNTTDVYEYGFNAGSPGPLIRRTHTEYLSTNPVNGVDYASSISIHIRSLVEKQFVYDAGGVPRARVLHEYDKYTPDANHAGLVDRSNITRLEPSFTTSYLTRGNLTATTNYLLNTSGGVTGTISKYQQYDIAGNAVKTIDGRGYATELDFSDRYGTPDNNAQANSGATELGTQVSYAFPTKATNALAHTVFTQFDYYLGKPVNIEDANGIVSSFHYGDLLDRPTQINRAINQPAANQTTFSYDDQTRVITTFEDLHLLNDNFLVSQILYDGLGRTTESRQYEAGSNYIATQTQYDALGRAYKTSNPFRPWQSQTPVWTTQTFDALGRVISVTTPDNALVSSSYSANTVTVTDQAGKARKSVNDALGRLIEVYEDPNGLNHQTMYLYDALDNLVKVTQGTQQRYFMYDSLKRLIRARNPEQNTLGSLNLSDPISGNSTWSIGYLYDSNNNLTEKTDARNVVSTFVYDALNRNTTTNYSDTAIDPDVKRFYDGPANGKGRFWYFYSGGDYYTGSNVDHTSIDSYDALGRPLVQRQLFKLNNEWSATYQTSRTYNRAGGVVSQLYPSGHSVTYNYDQAGRLADKDAANPAFTGDLGDGVQRTYATGITYSPWGTLSREQFGTNTAVYNKRHYNIRGQLCDVRASNVNDEWGGEHGALVNYYSTAWAHCGSGTDNNGNVLMSQTIINSYYMEDRYTYDSLNRLSAVNEWQNGSSQTGSQQYDYDRWGNRTIKTASWGTGINTKQFTVDTDTNRLGVPGGQSGVMAYDNAGNLITDTYTGTGARTYNAENKMLTAADNTGQTSRYTYDADGRRTRRQVANSQEVWHLYGFDGELLAEYRAPSPASAPEKEYGYRNGQLLVTATGRYNVALAANGAVATASSANTCCGYSTQGAINGNNRGPWGNGEGWNDGTPNSVPDWIQVDFAGSKTIDEISVFSLHDNYTQENTPTETQTFTLYGLLGFDVQYWNGSSWTTIPGGSVTGNNKVWRKFTFSPITTSKIRVWINAVPDSWSRVVEIQAYGISAGAEKIQWLIADHLGTPRMVFDQSGTVVKRHDYLPFGEELSSGVGGRSPELGYSGGDGIRQQFTEKERDTETGLDYFGARYYASTQGRFCSTDPKPVTKESFLNPQRWNLYVYVNNNPLGAVDPNGADGQGKGGDKVISVFLDFSLKDLGRRVTTDSSTKKVTKDVPNTTDWQGTASAAQNGYRVEVFGDRDVTGEKGLPQLITGAAFNNALKNSEVVIYVGHGRGDPTTVPFVQQGIQAGNTYYTPSGTTDALQTAIVPEGTQLSATDPKPDTQAAVVGNLSCNASRNGNTYFNFTGNNQVMVTMNSNWDGVTSFDALDKAANAFVKTYMNSGGNVQKAIDAANKVLTSIPGGAKQNVGDRIEATKVN